MSDSRDIENFSELPPELQVEILSHLGPKALVAMSHVSKRFFEIINDDMWKKRLALHFPEVPHKEETYLEDYIKAYQENFKDLPPNIKSIFWMVVEKDAVRLKKIELEENLFGEADSRGRTIIDWAFIVGSQVALNRFYELVSDTYKDSEGKLDIEKKDDNDMTILDWAGRLNQSLEEIKRLVELGADVTEINNSSPLLHVAAGNGKLELVQYLLEEMKMDIDTPNEFGETGLMWAIEKGQNKVAEYFMEKNANLNAQDTSGMSAIFIAAKFNNFELLKKFAEKGAAIDPFCGYEPHTPLNCAALNRNLEMVQFLVEKNPDLSLEDVKDALFYAAQEGEVNIFKYLVQVAAEKGEVLSFNSKTVSLAAEFGNLSLVKYLVEELHCNVNTDPGELKVISPLSEAAKRGHMDVVKYLLEQKAAIVSVQFYGEKLDPDIQKVIDEEKKKRAEEKALSKSRLFTPDNSEPEAQSEDKPSSDFGIKKDRS